MKEGELFHALGCWFWFWRGWMLLERWMSRIDGWWRLCECVTHTYPRIRIAWKAESRKIHWNFENKGINFMGKYITGCRCRHKTLQFLYKRESRSGSESEIYTGRIQYLFLFFKEMELCEIFLFIPFSIEYFSQIVFFPLCFYYYYRFSWRRDVEGDDNDG